MKIKRNDIHDLWIDLENIYKNYKKLGQKCGWTQVSFDKSCMSSGSCPRSRREGGGVKERENPLRWRISLFTQWMLSKKPPPPERRGTRSNGAGKSTAVEDFAPFSVEAVQREGGGVKERKLSKMPPPPRRRIPFSMVKAEQT